MLYNSFYCPVTKRILICQGGDLNVYSRIQDRLQLKLKIKTPIKESDNPIVACGHAWQGAEGVAFVAWKILKVLNVYSTVDGSLLQTVEFPYKIKQVKYGCLKLIVLLENCNVIYCCDDIDKMIEAEENMNVEELFRVVKVNMNTVNDVDIINARPDWPTNDNTQVSLIAVGEHPACLLVSLAQDSSTSFSLNTVLSKLSLLGKDSVGKKAMGYVEDGRRIERVQVVDQKIYCFTDHHRLLIFNDLLMLVGYEKGNFNSDCHIFGPFIYNLRLNKLFKLGCMVKDETELDDRQEETKGKLGEKETIIMIDKTIYKISNDLLSPIE